MYGLNFREFGILHEWPLSVDQLHKKLNRHIQPEILTHSHTKEYNAVNTVQN